MTMKFSHTLIVFAVSTALLVLLPDPVASQHVVLSLEDDLEYDANGKLVTHQLVYTEGCASTLSSALVPDRFEFHQVAGKARADLFGTSTTTTKNDDDVDSAAKCQAACIERGVDKTLAFAVLPHHQYTAAADGSNLVDWLRDGCSRVEVCLMNYVDETDPLTLYWMRDNGEKKFHLSLEYGERKTRCFSSFVGHRFTAETKDGTAVGAFTVEFTTILAFGAAPTLVKPDEDKTQQIRTTLQHEWNRHNRVQRTFSPLGFAKGRLPDDVFASMSALYYNNRFYKVNEEWKGKGVFVNWVRWCWWCCC